MGSYSHLTIGQIVFSWKYHVPTFLTFVFKESDLFMQREESPHHLEDDEEPPEVDLDEPSHFIGAGYRTSVAAAKAVLDEYGYTLEFFAEIYDSFRPGLQASVRERLEDELARRADRKLPEEELQRRVREHLAASPDTPVDDLSAFTAFLREAIEKDLQMEPFLEDRILDRGPGQEPLRIPAKEYLRYKLTDLADFETLQMLLIDRAAQVPASVLRPACLFDEGYVDFFPEVISLIYTRLILDAMPDDAVVELEVSQVIESEAELRSMHSNLAYELLHKVDVYERVFRALSSREEEVQDRYARTQVRNALSGLNRASGAQSKGEALEALMAAAFSINPQLQVVQRTYSTGDEEIDLIVKNNVNRPFWQGLASPLLFAECKNWSDPVGASEIRNFEAKLQNHAPLARVGVLVAPGGFTREAVNAIKRSSRDPYTLALVRREDLEQLARGASSVLDWLEELLCRPV
jgi:hypothetical protein